MKSWASKNQEAKIYDVLYQISLVFQTIYISEEYIKDIYEDTRIAIYF